MTTYYIGYKGTGTVGRHNRYGYVIGAYGIEECGTGEEARHRLAECLIGEHWRQRGVFALFNSDDNLIERLEA